MATDVVGDIVRIRATKVGNVFQVEKVDVSTSGSLPAVAIVRKKDSPTNAIVHFHGPLRGIYASLSPGSIYLVGTDARPAKVGDANYPVVGSDYFQQIGVATSSDELLVIPLGVSFGGGGPAGAVRFFNQAFNEVPDGVRTSFTTAMPFRHGGVDSESVHYGGQRLLHGAGNDYLAAESGGGGTGFDTIVMSVPPKSWSNFLVDFVPDV